MRYHSKPLPHSCTSLLILLGLSIGVAETVAQPLPEPEPIQTTQFTELPIALQAVASENMGRNDAAFHITDNHAFDNPVHNVSAAFDRSGVTFAHGADDTWTLHYIGVGYGDDLIASVAPANFQSDANRAEYVRGDLTEWYVNGPRGIQQGVTLQNPPTGERGELTVAFDMSGTLSAEGQGDSIRLVRDDGTTAFTYSGLIAFDAAGRDLPARMAVEDGRLTLHADDTDAVYPVTIDPFVQEAYLKASNTGGADWFGTSVAVDGDTVVVGAYFEDSNATGVNGPNNNLAETSGAAYVFVRTGTTWTQQAYLKASNTGGGDWFGTSVAVDGDTVVVGARGEGSNATGVDGPNNNLAATSGAAYVFVRSVTTWTQQAYLKASNTDANDQFGWSVAVDGDGNTVVVGARGEDSNATGVDGNEVDNSAGNSGAAYVFERSVTTWTQQAYLKASNTDANDQFGWSVAVDGNTVVVGARLEDSNATGVNGPNNNLAATSGAAYVFVRSVTTWTQQAYLKASNTGFFDEFGFSVAVAGDTVVVGARLEDSSATGVNGDEADNSVNDSGAAYVFDLPRIILDDSALATLDEADVATTTTFTDPVGESS